MAADASPKWAEPTTLPELNLPPTFVADHCVRTLSYKGAMSSVDIARHWLVHDDIAFEVVESLKANGLVEPDSGQGGFERLGRVRLSQAGQAYVATARARTWYAGALPVSLDELEQRLRPAIGVLTGQDEVRAALEPFAIEDRLADEIGQAIASGAPVALAGIAYDEQADIATALGRTLTANVRLPYAIFAAGAVIRLVDARRHAAAMAAVQREGGTDILRSPTAASSRWMQARPAVVALSGGVLQSDVVPAYDEDAKFYVAPAPLVAYGGLLSIFDAASDPEALGELVRLWLVPGRHGSAVLLLRSGERIELPWRAATVLFGATPAALPAPLRDALFYAIDVSELSQASLRQFLLQRLLNAEVFTADVIDRLARGLDREGKATRTAAAGLARYVRDRAEYAGAAFVATPEFVEDAIGFIVASGRLREVQRAA